MGESLGQSRKQRREVSLVDYDDNHGISRKGTLAFTLQGVGHVVEALFKCAQSLSSRVMLEEKKASNGRVRLPALTILMTE